MGDNDIAIVMGGLLLVVAGGALLFKGCDLGIQSLCRKPLEEVPVGIEGQFPRVRMSEAMEYIANQIVQDIDASTFLTEGRERLFEIKGLLFDDFQDELEEVAEYNDVRLQPLQGRALSKYSQLLMKVARRAGISLNPDALLRYQANLFAGTPMSGNLSVNYARSRYAQSANHAYGGFILA